MYFLTFFFPPSLSFPIFLLLLVGCVAVCGGIHPEPGDEGVLFATGKHGSSHAGYVPCFVLWRLWGCCAW